MGLLCSKNFSNEEVNAVADLSTAGEGIEPSNICANGKTDLAEEPVRRSVGNHSQNLKDQILESSFSNRVSRGRKGSSVDDFYDGIPVVPATLSYKSRSMRSTQAAVAKVSEISLRLGRAGTMGLEKAVEVLDVLGSSMTDLNSRSGFASGVVSRGTKISILAFEVANTIMKGACLMHSLSESHLQHLKEVVLPSEPVRKLISKDEDELLRIVASDKREELALFSGEVIRFGNCCKDPQWHNLDRYFLKQSREVSPHKQLKEDAKSLMQQLVILVQYTAELYHELHALDRFEKECQSRSKAEVGSHGNLWEELKKQKKLVKKLKKRSLWSGSLEEIMEKLVDVVVFLHIEISDSFDNGEQYEDTNGEVEDPVGNDQRLGPAGLSLHYANIILQFDGIVGRSCSIPSNARESLYQSLPPSIKSSLRSRLQSFHFKEELTVAEIKAEMEKTLQWLVPIASNTVKSHHGFGWVGEWANSGFEASETPLEKADLVRIETLYHADKLKTEAYITEQLVWLHYLVLQSQASMGFVVKSTIKAPAQLPFHERQNSAPNVSNVPSDSSAAEEHHVQNDMVPSDPPAAEEHHVQNDIDAEKKDPEISKSEVSDSL